MNQCEKCEGYGVIEGKYCDCSIGDMTLRDALNRGDHVAIAFNHETGKKDVFVDHKHAPVAPSRSAVPCPKCGIGVDTNSDGDCEVCTSPAYQQRASAAPPSEREATDEQLQKILSDVMTEAGITWYPGRLLPQIVEAMRRAARAAAVPAPGRDVREEVHQKAFYHECDQGAGKYIVLLDDVDAILADSGATAPPKEG